MPAIVIADAFVLALLGWLLTGPLIAPGEIFAAPRKWFFTLINPLASKAPAFYQVVAKVLSCAKCFTGWLTITFQVITLQPDIRQLILAVALAAIIEKTVK